MEYKAVFHVDQNEEGVMNLALNNVINLLNGIPDEEYDLVVLFNGPAVRLVAWDDVVVYLERIKDLAGKGVRFQVCRNALERFEVTEDLLIEECEIIPAGIVALIDLQNSGFCYIKP